MVKCTKPAAEINQMLLEHNILGGYDLGRDYTEMENHLMFAVTEMNSREDIDELINALTEAASD